MKSRLKVTTILLCLLPLNARAQTSIGFSDPTDLGTLRDYRLPDWGYRTTVLSFDFTGSGFDEGSVNDNRAQTEESLDFTWYRENERRTWTIRAIQRGNWDWSQVDVDSSKSIAGRVQGQTFVTGNAREYVSDNVFVTGSTQLGGNYNESRIRTDSNRVTNVNRTFSAFMRLGVGLGRLRDVTPVLQALRLSERVRTLGREPLAPNDVARMADVLARGGGYQTVFDRSDRRFWRDILELLGGEGAPLSPFEVFYLREASFEQLGARREGSLVNAGVELARSTTSQESPGDDLGPWLNGSWSHNLSLNHQVSANFSSSYLWNQSQSRRQVDRGQAALSGSFLWVLADRIFWNNSISGSIQYLENESGFFSRSQGVNLGSRCSYYIEDRISLAPELSVGWQRHGSSGDDARDSRNWRLAVNLTYDISNALF